MTSNETNCTEFLKSALETQVIVSSGEWLIVVSDYVGSGMRPTTKCAEGGGERQDSVTNGLRQIDCHLSNDVGRLGNEQEAKHKEVQQAAAVTAVASNGKALKCQSSDRIAKTNGLTKAVALLVKGMTRERFLQNGETAGILKQLEDETSVDLTALEKKGLDLTQGLVLTFDVPGYSAGGTGRIETRGQGAIVFSPGNSSPLHFPRLLPLRLHDKVFT